jgi:Fe-S oxidoreductase
MFHPHVGKAAVDVLEDAGWRVTIPTEPLCCALTWISTGQLATAKRVLRRTVKHLASHVQSGGLVVGLEPSCTAVFRSDALDLFPEDRDVRRLAKQTVTLAELLMHHTDGWAPPDLSTVAGSAIAQVHCHQHAVTGWDADAQLLDAAGVDVEELQSGCCGLAGNFGFTAGHGDVSKACAERVLLPRVRGVDNNTVVLADGFSCRMQVHDLDSNGREAVHLAELLAARGPRAGSPSTPIESQLAERPQPLSPAARLGLLTAIPTIVGTAVVTIIGACRRRRAHSLSPTIGRNSPWP